LNRSLVQILTLGADLNEAGFEDVRGYGVDSQGRIWVGEWDGIVHTFQPDGRLIRTWERQGEGPGEFRYIAALDTDPATQRIVVRDVYFMKILNEDLEEVARWQIPRVPLGGSLPGVRFEPGGSAVLFPIGVGRDSVMRDTLRLVWTPGLLLRAALDGTQLDTVGTLVGGWSKLPPGISSMSSPPTAGAAIWLPIDTAGVLIGDGQRSYELHLVSASGDTIRTFRRPLPRERLDEPGPEFTRGFVQRAAFDAHRRELLACRTQPPDVRTHFAPVAVDHWSLDGDYLGTLTWPACPRYVSPDGTVFLTTRGQLNVPVVLGFRYAGDP
jgi:hypothetical protein